MFCGKCGAQLEDDAKFVRPVALLSNKIQHQKSRNHLVLELRKL